MKPPAATSRPPVAPRATYRIGLPDDGGGTCTARGVSAGRIAAGRGAGRAGSRVVAAVPDTVTAAPRAAAPRACVVALRTVAAVCPGVADPRFTVAPAGGGSSPVMWVGPAGVSVRGSGTGPGG